MTFRPKRSNEGGSTILSPYVYPLSPFPCKFAVSGAYSGQYTCLLLLPSKLLSFFHLLLIFLIFSPRHLDIPIFTFIAFITFITFIVITSIAIIILAFCSGVFPFVFAIDSAVETVAREVEVFPFFNLWGRKACSVMPRVVFIIHKNVNQCPFTRIYSLPQ